MSDAQAEKFLTFLIGCVCFLVGLFFTCLAIDFFVLAWLKQEAYYNDWGRRTLWLIAASAIPYVIRKLYLLPSIGPRKYPYIHRRK